MKRLIKTASLSPVMKSAGTLETMARGVRFSLPVLTGALVLALCGSGPADAKDYTRSCSATYHISASTLSGGRLQGAQFPFSGSGVIGYYNPNEARRRARRAIDSCIEEAWHRRHGTSTPTACTPSRRISNYPFTGLHFGIQQAVCLANPGHAAILVNVNVQYSGKKGCLLDHNVWNSVVTRAYRIDCPTREFEENTDRPGMDYRHFTPSRAHSSVCRNTCIAESRCRAWTYVAPNTTQGPRATCWLKDGVPTPRPASCCTSGVKTDM